PIPGEGVRDVTWLNPAGNEMTDTEWDQAFARALGVYLVGAALERFDRRGRPITDRNFLLLFNAHFETIPFTLPPCRAGCRWRALLDTARADAGEAGSGALLAPADGYPLEGRSLALLSETDDE
ncbi:MAG: glycogen debranching protein GlgX, partial [Steroidobacteraceae bacterium]